MEQAVQPEAGVSMTAGASRDEQWAHEQVVAPDVANQLVVNRGAIFIKIGKASRVLGVRQKSERLVWLSGVGSEQKICWRKLLPRSSITGLHLRARVAGVFRDRRGGVGGGHKHTGVVREPACSHEGEHSEEASSMAVCDVVSISISPPAHVSADSDRCLHLESSSRSLLLEAKDKGERDFWYEELSRSIRTARELQCEEQRRARQRERDLGMHERKQIWETKVLPHFETARTQPSTLQLCWPGVPTNVRARLWHKCIGNQLQITPELFAIFRLHASRARHASTLTPCAEAEESAFKVLDKDLPRTFANLGFFHKGGPLEEQLREVLETYCVYRPDVSYVQGMSYLAGMLLLCMEDKYQAFVSLANLLHPPHYFLAFFAMDTLQIKIRFNVISVFFERHLPALFSRFHHLNVTMVQNVCRCRYCCIVCVQTPGYERVDLARCCARCLCDNCRKFTCSIGS